MTATIGPAGSRVHDARVLPELIALLGLALVAAIDFILRFDGRWTEADTGLMAQAIRDVVATGQMAPGTPGVYANGYGYQVVSAAIVALTGLDVTTLQQVIYPLTSALVVIPAWLLYREATGSGRTASLAVLFLLLVPEHLFAVLRGSHERLDRMFLLTALWLLVRVVRLRQDPVRVGIHLALALVAMWGLVATNALFGMSLVAAAATGLVLTWIVRNQPGVRGQRGMIAALLGWTVLSGSVLVAALVSIYPPVWPTMLQLGAIPGRLLEILQGAVAFNPYAGVLSSWVSPEAYLVMSAADFLLLTGSAVAWLWLGRSWLRGPTRPFGFWILWLLYAGLAAQGLGAVIADRTAVLGTNAQYRMFAVFATMAAPILALAIGRVSLGPRVRVLAGLAVVALGVVAMLKTTLDPAIANRWIFYTEGELQGLQWADAHQRQTSTWIGLDDRLSAVYATEVGYPTAGNRWDVEQPDADTRAFLVSHAAELQGERLDEPAPSPALADVLYDNGDARLYRLVGPP